MEEIEYIPFYGELKMTETKKEVAKKKLLKAKPHTEEAALAAAEMLVLTAQEQRAEETITKEIVTTRTQEVIKEIQTSKAHVIAETLEESIEVAKTWVDVPDVPEPGTTDVALSNTEADVTRRGYTTMLMAQAARNNTKNPSDYLIVELRDVQSAILAYYIVHKAEEL